jgi:DNA-binding NarL/FixJ family response regulator
METKTVLVTARGEIFREGLVSSLKREEELQVVSVCQSGHQAIEQAIKFKPDIILLDDEITDCDFLKVAESILKAQLNASIIILTNGVNTSSILSVLSLACVKAYVTKDIDIYRLVDVIGSASKGCLMLSPSIVKLLSAELEKLKTNVKMVTQKSNFRLTKRQLETLTLVSEGLTNKDIAARLFISENTVKAHIKNLLEKLNVENRQQAITIALANGIIPDQLNHVSSN